MLSRRSARIKVMQVLFAVSRDEMLDRDSGLKRYWEFIDQSYELFLFNIYNLIQITKQSVDDELNRKSKHLPKEKDKSFTAKLYENELINSLSLNNELNKKVEGFRFKEKINGDYIKKLYAEFAKEQIYQDFLDEESTKDKYAEVLLELFKFCRKNELYNEMMDDQYTAWIDDKSLIIGSIKKVLKALPTNKSGFFQSYYPDDETVKEFGEQLYLRTFEANDALLEKIKPVLKNWDHERLAIVDMILIKMAVTEFLHFKTIPTKVTLNEYVEVAKLYSTDKSKDFVNGVLDKLLKEFEEAGDIQKEGRGLID